MKKGFDLAVYEKDADLNNYIYFNKEKCEEEIVTSPHFHDSIELVVCVKGKCCVCINGADNVLMEGDGVFVDRFDVHYYKYFTGSEYYVLLVSEKYLDDDNGFKKKRLPVFLPKGEKYPKIKRVFDDIYALYDARNDVLKKGIVNIILGIMTASYPLEDRKSKGEAQVLVNALLYINENFKNDITLEFMSRKLGYSKNYFSFLFNKFTGMNFREYINRRRICEFERIRSETPNLPIYIAVEKSGFLSSKTFYRAYEKHRENRNF